MSERAKYWRRLIGEWKRSGLSQAEFCRRREVNVGSFAWWKSRIGNTANQHRRRVGRNASRSPAREVADFVELALPKGTRAARSLAPSTFGVGPCGYEIVLSNGRVIRLPHNFDPAVVAQLVTAMESC